MRVAAAEALASMGNANAELVKPLVHDSDENVRIAAVRVLLNLDEEDWLKRELGLTANNAQ